MLAQRALRRTHHIASHLAAATNTVSARYSSSRPSTPKKEDDPEKTEKYYKYWLDITTRWKGIRQPIIKVIDARYLITNSDNDQYGHVNNATYYTMFDSVVNTYLIKHCGLDPASIRTNDPQPIFYVVSSNARYHAPASFPERLRAGMAIAKLGRSSVVYHVAVFKQGKGEESWECAVTGEFVHVCVDPKTGRPMEIGSTMREGLERVLIE